jgi:transposase
VSHKDICRLAGISANTLRVYLRKFQSGGVKALMELNFRVPQSELELHRHYLKAYFRDRPPATISEAAAKIHELTGLKRSPSAVGNFLHSLGLAPKRVVTIPSKANPVKQEHFRINELEPRLEEARQGKRAIFLSMLSLCAGCLFRHPLVLLPSLRKNLCREKTFQRTWCIERDHP